MFRLLMVCGMLVVACVLAGAYGAGHNQISYTVSPEYFHAFKFPQFGIPAEWQNRSGAALVGVRAAWWMGILVGVPLIWAGRKFADPKVAARRILLGELVAVATALVVGLAALALSFAVVTPEGVASIGFRVTVIDRVAFVRAGIMHDASYLGGLLGIATGWFAVRLKQHAVPPSTDSKPPV